MKNLFKRLLEALTREEKKEVKKELDKTFDEGIHNISDNGVKFIAVKEGYYKNLYNDVAGHCTIAYGYLLHHGPCIEKDYKKWGAGVTKEEALKLLKTSLKRYVTGVNVALKVSQNQHQFDALVAFCYNIGIEGLKNSSCLRLINQNANIFKIEKRWKVWNKIINPETKKLTVCKGLINRRQWEWDLYSKSEYGSLEI